MTFDYKTSELKLEKSVTLDNNLTEANFIEKYGNEKVNLVVKNGDYSTYIMKDIPDGNVTFNFMLSFYKGKIRMINLVPKLLSNSYTSSPLDREIIEKICKDIFGSLHHTYNMGKVECIFDPKNNTWGITIQFT